MWTKENIPDQTGKTVVVTGANSGIGYETALALYEAGAKVIVACRSAGKAEEAIAAMEQSGGSGALEPGVINLSSLDSVREFANGFRDSNDHLDVLINNAGVMMPPPGKTKEGFELQFGTNFLGHFLLTAELYPLLAAASNSRVVTLTSLAYAKAEMDFLNLKLEYLYDAEREYGQSKLANLMFALHLQDLVDDTGDYVMSMAAHPGVTKTSLSRNMPEEAYEEAVRKFGELMPASQGALPALFAAVSNDVEPGALYGPDQDGGLRGYPAKVAVQGVATNLALNKKLWALAENACKIKFP
jgi:NAD(P)-dependent dehydrogenase (short-subunit alcohol dehydrogenase family)